MSNVYDSMIDMQAEAGVIATILVHPEFMLNIEYLQPGYFYDKTNGCLFWAIQELTRSGVDNIDAFNITNMLNSNHGIKAQVENANITDIEAYVDLCQYTARETVEELILLANNVLTMSFKRKLYDLSCEIGRNCQNPNNDLDNLNTMVNESLTALTDRYVIGSDSVLFGNKIDAIWQDILSKRNEDGTFGIPSMLPILSRYFTYVEGEMVLVAGATGKGKSAFFLNETIDKCKRGVGVLYIDTELTDEVFFIRCLSHLVGLDYGTIQSGKYSDQYKHKIAEAMEFLHGAVLIHEYMPEFNRTKIEQLCRKWQLQANIGFVVFDYIKPDKQHGADTGTVSNGLGQMADFLKNIIAGRLELPVVAGIQMNTVTGLIADSQKPLRYCSTCLLWREKTVEELQRDGLECGNFAIDMLKNRNGESIGTDCYVDVNFDGGKMRITQAKQHLRPESPFS